MINYFFNFSNQLMTYIIILSMIGITFRKLSCDTNIKVVVNIISIGFASLIIGILTFVGLSTISMAICSILIIAGNMYLYKLPIRQNVFMVFLLTVHNLIIWSIFELLISMTNYLYTPMYFILKFILAYIMLYAYYKRLDTTLYDLLEEACNNLTIYVYVPIIAMISFYILDYCMYTKRISPLYLIVIILIGMNFGILYKSFHWIIDAKHTERMAYTDGLTGLYNRAAFNNYIKEIDENIRNNKQGKFAVIVIDLNFLKKINDNYGHDKGDIAIKILADDINAMFNTATCFRIGGDEFAVLVTDKNIDNTIYILDNFGASFCKTNKTNEWENISAAIGYAVISEHDKSFNDVFTKADANMYTNKRNMKAIRID